MHLTSWTGAKKNLRCTGENISLAHNTSGATGSTVMKLLSGFQGACVTQFLPYISFLLQNISAKTEKPYPEFQCSFPSKHLILCCSGRQFSFRFFWFRSDSMNETNERLNTLKCGLFARCKTIWAVGTIRQMTKTSSASEMTWVDAMVCCTIIFSERWSRNLFCTAIMAEFTKRFL